MPRLSRTKKSKSQLFAEGLVEGLVHPKPKHTKAKKIVAGATVTAVGTFVAIVAAKGPKKD